MNYNPVPEPLNKQTLSGLLSSASEKAFQLLKMAESTEQVLLGQYPPPMPKAGDCTASPSDFNWRLEQLNDVLATVIGKIVNTNGALGIVI